jgi:hypothetical protein
MTKIIYTPGVCNIGPEEIARRKNVGWIGLIATVVLVVLLFELHVAPVWRITVFLPAFVAASGFVQAYAKFCVAFGQAGVYNFGTVGTTQTVTDIQSKQRDVKKTAQLYVYIIVIAVIITALAIIL